MTHQCHNRQQLLENKKPSLKTVTTKGFIGFSLGLLGFDRVVFLNET